MPRDLLTVLIDPVERRGVTFSRCPVPSHGKGHGDRNRSLQSRQGTKGYLMKCWAGCNLEDICAAFGIEVKDLFYDGLLNPHQRRQALHRRAKEQATQQAADKARGRKNDLLKHAEFLVQSARGMNIEAWTPAQLNKRLNVLADAYAVLEGERYEQF